MYSISEKSRKMDSKRLMFRLKVHTVKKVITSLAASDKLTDGEYNTNQQKHHLKDHRHRNFMLQTDQLRNGWSNWITMNWNQTRQNKIQQLSNRENNNSTFTSSKKDKSWDIFAIHKKPSNIYRSAQISLHKKQAQSSRLFTLTGKQVKIATQQDLAINHR